eukprot:7214748-Prorocentrum_lima.AAC.1
MAVTVLAIRKVWAARVRYVFWPLPSRAWLGTTRALSFSIGFAFSLAFAFRFGFGFGPRV